MQILLLSIGAAAGALARYFLLKVLPTGIYSISIINIAGSFLLGFVNTLKIKGLISSNIIYIAISVGMIGAFTTFSTFINDTVSLFIKKEYLTMCIYFFASVIISIIFLSLGILLANRITR